MVVIWRREECLTEAGRWDQGLALQPEGPSGALPTEVSHAKSEGHGPF